MSRAQNIAKKIPVLNFFIAWTSSNDMDYGGFLAILVFVLLFFGLSKTTIDQAQVFSIVIALSPIWITYFLFRTFHWKWMAAVGRSFSLYNGRTSMRIKLPQDVFKSPEAMEFVFAQIHNTQNPDNLMQTYLQGKRPLTIGLEIASVGGDVRFYVNTPTKKSKASFEANMYAQYPGVEIVEEPVDYAAEIPLEKLDEYEMMSIHMGKRNDGEFPIKTYIEYGLDKLPKEEEKVDPMTPMLEVLSTIGPSERLYIQYIIKPFRKSSFKGGETFFGEGEGWDKNVLRKVDEIMQRDPATKAPVSAGGADFDGAPRITTGERNTVELMERNAAKYPYEVGIRFIYLSKKGHFNGDFINLVIRSFSQYDKSGPLGNTIGVRWRTDFNYKDFFPGKKKKNLDALKHQELKEFKLRYYYDKAQSDPTKIFSVEELATLFHLPGQVAITPNLGRIASNRSEAPSNLPIGDLPS